MEAGWRAWEIEDLLSTTASTGSDSSGYSTGEESEKNSYRTCHEVSSGDDFSVGSADLGHLLVRGRWTWTDDRLARYQRDRVDGWQDWRFFTENERLLRLTFQAFVDVFEQAIRRQNDDYINSLERETDSS